VPEAGKPADSGSEIPGIPEATLRAASALWRDLAAAGIEAPTRAPDAADLPEDLPDYEIVERLGAGGMGVVYRARHKSLGREVALKLLPAGALASSQAVDRFLREAKAAAAADHPAIVRVLDAGVKRGRPYIALQLVRGPSLNDLLAAGGRLEPRRAAAFIREVAEAAHAAHGAGVIHRDIKPGNVLVEPAGDSSSSKAYLADFGLAKLAHELSLTGTGQVLGTPSYMSPEQARGEPATAGSDVYSLGATLYALVAGRAPHEGASHAAILSLVAWKDPVPLATLLPSVPRDLATVCEKAMRWEPGRRYASALELCEDLERFLDGKPIRARPATWRYRGLLWLKRNPRALPAAGLSMLFVLLALTGEQWWRCERLLGTIQDLLAAEQVEEAHSRLGDLPWWPVRSERERLLRLEVLLLQGRLGEAARQRAGLQRHREEDVAARLRAAIEQAIEAAEGYLQAGLVRSALRRLEQAAAGLEEAGLGSESWRAARLRRAGLLALHGLIELGEYRAAGNLLDAEREGLRPGVLRAALEPYRHDGAGQAASSTESSPVEFLRELATPSGPASQAVPESALRRLSAVLDLSTPHLSVKENLRLERFAVVLNALRPAGAAVPVAPPSRFAVADLGGDGAPDLVVLSLPLRAQAFRCRPGGLEPWLDQVLHEEARPGNILLQDLDGDGAVEVILYYYVIKPSYADGYLQAYRLEEERLVPSAHEIGPLVAGPGIGSALCLADIDGDGALELIAGFGSGGRDARQVRVFWKPFTAECRAEPLPDGGAGSDVLSVFALDLDGDGRPEVGASTGPWKGFDLRFWKCDRNGRRFLGPIRFGPFGSFELAVPLERGGSGLKDLFLAKSSWTADESHFPPWPHTGLRPGAYLFQFPRGEKIAGCLISPAPGLESAFSWFDAIPEEIADPPDNLAPRSLSKGTWRDGRTAACVSWSLRRNAIPVSQWTDLYLEARAGRGMERHRIINRRGSGEHAAVLFNLPAEQSVEPAGPGAPALALLERGPEGSWEARLVTAGAERGPLPPLDVVRAYLSAGRYREALRRAREALELGLPEAQQAALAELQAGAAYRLLDLKELEEAQRRLRSWGRELPESLSKLASAAASLEAAPRRIPLETRASVVLEPFVAGHDVPFELPLMELDLEEASQWRLSFRVDIEELGWDRQVFIGLRSQGSPDSWYGVAITHTGGGGQKLRWPQVIWGEQRSGQVSLEDALEERSSYRILLIDDGAGRVLLRAERVGDDGRKEVPALLVALPPHRAWEQEGQEPAAVKVSPLPPGHYRFGLFEEPPTVSKPNRAHLKFHEIDLRLIPR
jgi:tetratricopeptide (TPR) repeat protein